MSQKVKVGIIGGGETGVSLKMNFMKYKFIEIVGLADIDENAEGIKVANDFGIMTTRDFNDIVALGKTVDILVDTVGKKEIRTAVRDKMLDSGNQHTIIMPELIVLLLEAMINDREEIKGGKHGFQTY